MSAGFTSISRLHNTILIYYIGRIRLQPELKDLFTSDLSGHTKYKYTCNEFEEEEATLYTVL
jgi:hypothetical protein